MIFVRESVKPENRTAADSKPEPTTFSRSFRAVRRDAGQ
jgi:hypothetical protein